MTKLVVATHNKGKKKEIAQMLHDLPIEVLMLDDLEQVIPEPSETGVTYEENALIKAKYTGDLAQLVTLADDSGLEVEALPGELGVRTARYAAGTDSDRNIKLLHALEGKANRNAKFVCCMVIYDPVAKTSMNFFGEMSGSIAHETRGNEGFGFDPVFIPQGYQQTFAELGSEEKNTISHRAKALQKVKAYLTSMEKKV